MVQAMQETGMRPNIIYAFEKTDGLLVTEDNRKMISEKDLQAWEAALDEYEARYGEGLALPLPWTRSEMKGKLVSELCDDPRAAEYLSKYRHFVRTDPETRDYYARILSSA